MSEDKLLKFCFITTTFIISKASSSSYVDAIQTLTLARRPIEAKEDNDDDDDDDDDDSDLT